MADVILPRTMTIEEFAPLVGRMFDVDCDPKSVGIRLVEVKPHLDDGMPGRPPFSLLFHSTPETMLVDGLYVMKCGSFGPEAIFINGVARHPAAPEGYYYQAVFN